MEIKKDFNKAKFIEEYKLTKEEYLFLPLEERLEYVRKYYGYLLENIPNVGDINVIKGILPEQFHVFFRANGCCVECYYYDGQETQIIRINDTKIEPNEEAIKRLDEYMYQVANAKADMFKSILIDIYKAKIAALNLDNTLPLEPVSEEEILNTISKTTITKTDLPTEVKEYIMSFQLSSIIRKVDEEGFAEMDINTALEYFEYLRKIGYVLEEPSQEKLHKFYDHENICTSYGYVNGVLTEIDRPYQTIKVLKNTQNNV